MKYATWLACLAATAFGQFSFSYPDANGVGFNATNTTSPVGGNTGTTLGEQRRIVIEAAAARWAEFLQLNGPVAIEARFATQTCSQSSGVLATAGSTTFSRNFPGAPMRNVNYVAPLVNHLTGTDRFPNLPEMRVTVNLALDDDSGCLGGRGFYYGLDGNSGFQTDLFAVLLHEIGHGLGFLTLVDSTFGTFPSGVPDSFAMQLYDLSQRRAWSEMTSAQRVDSARNEPFLVWQGESTNAAARELLVGQTADVLQLDIDGVAETVLAVNAAFGPGFSRSALNGEVQLIDDGVAPTTDACEDLPAGSLNGKIALIDRGTCLFVDKVRRAQEAGAIAVLVANNNADELIVMGGSDPNNEINIPSAMIHRDIGQLLRSGQTNFNVTLERKDPAGMSLGHLRIFAPNPFEGGSSIAHWTRDASPNLLMEPSLGTLTRDDPGLTLTAMREIGWDVANIPFPHLTYDIWVELELDGQSAANQLRTADPDGDGLDNFTEYAQGSDPLQADANAGNRFSLTLTGATQRIEYQGRGDATDLTFSLVESDTLDNWQPVPNNTKQLSEINDGIRREVFSFSTSTLRNFYRLEVTEGE